MNIVFVLMAMSIAMQTIALKIVSPKEQTTSTSNQIPIVTSVNVVSIDPPDLRGVDLYRIVWKSDNQSGMIHRSWEEFHYFVEIALRFLPSLPNPGASATEMDQWVQSALTSTPDLVTNDRFTDFLALDVHFCDNLTWFSDFEGLIQTITAHRPWFMPEPPNITLDNILIPETLFECYLFLTAYQDGYVDLSYFVELNANYTNAMPSFESDSNEDVAFPGFPISNSNSLSQPMPVGPVHFSPGGYLNGQNVRIYYASGGHYNFDQEPLIEQYLRKLHAGRNPSRILDIGCGVGHTAFVFGEIFPQATTIGIDQGAAWIRFAKLWQQNRTANNVEFYQVDATNMSQFQNESFDIVHFSYVLHEMMAPAAQQILSEIYRILKPGGVLSAFDVPYETNEFPFEMYAEFNTWGDILGKHDFEVYGFHGPEPYVYEYLYNTKPTDSMENIGFRNVTEIAYSSFDAIFLAFK